jgi:hypothetical protein
MSQLRVIKVHAWTGSEVVHGGVNKVPCLS